MVTGVPACPKGMARLTGFSCLCISIHFTEQNLAVPGGQTRGGARGQAGVLRRDSPVPREAENQAMDTDIPGGHTGSEPPLIPALGS